MRYIATSPRTSLRILDEIDIALRRDAVLAKQMGIRGVTPEKGEVSPGDNELVNAYLMRLFRMPRAERLRLLREGHRALGEALASDQMVDLREDWPIGVDRPGGGAVVDEPADPGSIEAGWVPGHDTSGGAVDRRPHRDQPQDRRRRRRDGKQPCSQ